MSATKYTLHHPKKLLENFSSTISWTYNKYFNPELLLETYLIPLDDALEEINKRRNNPTLQHSVYTYLNGDIPQHFKRETPVLYLSRHVPTPNEETLDFIEKCHNNNPSLPIIIGQDIEDIFTSNNVLKRNLGKMPVNMGEDKNGDMIKKNVTIVDFPSAQGKKLKDVTTVCGVSLVEFHTNLLTQTSPYNFEIADESDWITRNNRGNLLEHYKKFLSLLIVHGIMFEFYEPEDKEFVKNILLPSLIFVQKKFGCTPLITRLVEKEDESKKDWNGYPSETYQYLEVYADQKKCQQDIIKQKLA